MAQLKDILRGCVATYVAGTFLLFITELPSALTLPSMFTLWESLLLFVVYGAFFAFFTTLIVLLIWLVLASRKATISFPWAPFSGGAILCWLGLLLAGKSGLVVGFALGALAGIYFWYWAFGRVWDVRMGFR